MASEAFEKELAERLIDYENTIEAAVEVVGWSLGPDASSEEYKQFFQELSDKDSELAQQECLKFGRVIGAVIDGAI